MGLGRRLLVELEARAMAAGWQVVRMDSNGTLAEAIAMYRAAGYREVPPFNDEPHANGLLLRGFAKHPDMPPMPLIDLSALMRPFTDRALIRACGKRRFSVACSSEVS